LRRFFSRFSRRAPPHGQEAWLAVVQQGLPRRQAFTLAEAFTGRHGHRRPELVRRFEAIPMLALEREAFVEVLRARRPCTKGEGPGPRPGGSVE
jgi:hypothetical protein